MARGDKKTILFTSMQETITLDHDISRGLEEAELKEFINDTQKPSVRKMLERLLNLHEGEDILLAATEERENYTGYLCVVKGEKMKSGKFDVLVIRATQAKQVDMKRLIATGVTAVSAGVIGGSTRTPVAGVFAGGAILGATDIKTVFDFQKSHSDLIYKQPRMNLFVFFS